MSFVSSSTLSLDTYVIHNGVAQTKTGLASQAYNISQHKNIKKKYINEMPSLCVITILK
jgi:hypothetical protein